MMPKGPLLDILSLPSAQRQLIIVQPDHVVVAAREAEKTRAESPPPAAGNNAQFMMALIMAVISPWSLLISTTALEGVKAWAKAREGGLDILLIAHSEAAPLQFPPGHPRTQTMYVAHPAASSVYYTTASFHRMAFEHKFSEAIRLLMGLGASRITVEHIRGWSEEFSTAFSMGLGSEKIKASAGANGSASSKILFKATFQNHSAPVIPEGLVWYQHEPTWQTIAAGRLKHGLQEFSLNVTYEDDFGVNAGLKTRAQGAGFELGGSFEDHVATVWTLQGEFTPRER